MNNLYPNDFIYKIIFRDSEFILEDFLSVLTEHGFCEQPDYSIRKSSGGKYTSITLNIRIECEDTADSLNGKIYGQPGIVNYYVGLAHGGKNEK